MQAPWRTFINLCESCVAETKRGFKVQQGSPQETTLCEVQDGLCQLLADLVQQAKRRIENQGKGHLWEVSEMLARLVAIHTQVRSYRITVWGGSASVFFNILAGKMNDTISHLKHHHGVMLVAGVALKLRLALPPEIVGRITKYLGLTPEFFGRISDEDLEQPASEDSFGNGSSEIFHRSDSTAVLN